jgi:L-fuculose-phosphate aldolase
MLRFQAPASERTLRTGIVECGRICYERHLMTANDGNLSVRLSETRILITPAGVSKGRMKIEDPIVVDSNGSVTEPLRGRRPSSETAMHLEIYKARPEACAVIHAHPIFATALTVAGMEFPSDILPEVLATVGEVPVTPYATPSSQDDAEAIRPFVLEHSAILLRQHGAVTFGVDLEEALVILERVEHVAEVFWRARMLGHVEHLTSGARERLIAMRGEHLKK